MKTTSPKHTEFVASSNDSPEKLSKIYDSLKTTSYIMSAWGKTIKISKEKYNKLVEQGMSHIVKAITI